MKKLALTNLMLLIAIKSVSACEYFNYSNDPNFVDPITENNFYAGIFLFSSVFLLLAIIISYFLSGRKKLWFVIVAIVSVFLMIPLTFIFGLIQDCGESFVKVIGGYSLFLLCLFTFQIILWIILKRKLNAKLP